MAGAAARELRERGIAVDRVWAGQLPHRPGHGRGLAERAARSTTTCWPRWTRRPQRRPGRTTICRGRGRRSSRRRRRAERRHRHAGRRRPGPPGLEAVAEALIAVRDELTELDREVGDGDLGISLARGSAAVLAECPAYPGENGPAAVLRADVGDRPAQHRRHVRPAVRDHAAARGRRPGRVVDAAARGPGGRGVGGRAASGTDGVREVGGAEVGDRTMVDALVPAAEAFEAAAGRRCSVAGRAVRGGRRGGGGRGGHCERPGPARPVELSGRPGSRPPGPGRPGGGPLAGRDRRAVADHDLGCRRAGVVRLPSGVLVRGRGLRHPLPAGPAAGVRRLSAGPAAAGVGWESRWVRWPDFRLPSDRPRSGEVLPELAIGRRSSGWRSPAAAVAGAPAPRWPAWPSWTGCRPARRSRSSARHYDPRAVETPWQRRYVRKFLRLARQWTPRIAR